MYNVGNTCFLNAALQCLAYVPPVVNILLSKALSRDETEWASRMPLVDSTLCGSFKISSPRSTANRGAKVPWRRKISFAICARLPKLRVGRQEDAHEFMRYFIDALQKCCLREAGLADNETGRLAETTLVHQIFGGYLESHVKCSRKSCRYVSRTFEPFLDISLDIRRHNDKLEDALARFTQDETLRGNNKWLCGGCGQKVVAHKGFAIKAPPSALVVHLKRFLPGRKSSKINSFVEFPATLDLFQFLSEKSRRREEEGLRDCVYELTGVLVHAGSSMNSGHYMAYVRASNGVWNLMDDSSVSQVGARQVLRQRAYMLFYVKKAAPSAKRMVEETSRTPQSPSVLNDEGEAVTVEGAALAAAMKKAVKNPAKLPDGSQPVYKTSLFGDFLKPEEAEREAPPRMTCSTFSWS